MIDSGEQQLKSKSAMINIDTLVLKEIWKYKIFKIMVVSSFLMAIWSVIAAVMVYSALEFHHVPNAYGVDKYGRVITLTPLDKPNLRNEAVGKIFSDMLEDVFTFDPVHYKSQLNKSGSLYFTQTGFVKFANEMKKKDGFLDFVLKNTAITTAMTRGVPTLKNAGVLNGRFSWRFTVPIAIDFRGAGTHGTRYYRVTGILSRQSRAEYEHGIAIESLSILPISEKSL